MDFTIKQHLDATPAKIAALYLDADFLASINDPHLAHPELLDQQRNGSVVNQRIRYHFTAELSSAVRRVIDPDRLSWVEESTHDLHAHTTTAHIVPDHYADRLEASYEVAMSRQGTSTRRVTTGLLTVHMHFVGARVENVIVSGLQDHGELESAAVAQWLAR
jgi:Protein of unknown function (DUF2505)